MNNFLLKKYTPIAYPCHHPDCCGEIAIDVEEDLNGHWYKVEDVEALIKSLEQKIIKLELKE